MTAEESVRYSLLLAATSIHLRQHGIIFPLSSLLHIDSLPSGAQTLIFNSKTMTPLPSKSLNLLQQLSTQSKSLFDTKENLDLKEVRARVIGLIDPKIFDPHVLTCISAWTVRDRSLLSSVKDEETIQFDDFVSKQSKEHKTVIGNLLKARKNHLPPHQLYPDLIFSSVGSAIMDSPYLSLLITEETSKQILKEESAKILLHLLFMPTQTHLLAFHQRVKLMELLKNILTLPGTNCFYPTDLCQLSLMILLSSSKTPITIQSKDVTGDMSVTPPIVLLSLCLNQVPDAIKTFKAIRIDNMSLVDFVFKSFLNTSNHLEQSSAINRHITNQATRTCLFGILNMLLDEDSNQDHLLEMLGKRET
ncbi:hypothetical protein BLNAU_6955 [Blattamonas nauphoetae]|uniref:Uncharacterized protein n=1 Tax=Blattamonas nauphoetae TaxID=2049346 RepID=A0ABQ9Y2Z3_9EUKA|nr:hypothetical protein BLNAU_6955 [Blattamonas nauphoetae]